MAISHVCLQCGFDLARVRVQREPHYGLPLVKCPKCAQVVIRQRHALAQGWRTFRKMDVALMVVAIQLTATVAAGMSCLAFSLNLEDVPHMLRQSRDTAAMLIFFAAIAVFTGAWLTAGFRHLPRTLVWLVWTCLLGLGTLLLIVIFTIDNQLSFHDEVQWSRTLDDIRTHWPPALLGSIIIMIASTIGIIPGLFANKVIDFARGLLWRRRRRRLRALRSGL